MARADLIVELVKYAVSGNKGMIKKVTEAIIAEERDKQHIILADRLHNELQKSNVDDNKGKMSNGGALPLMMNEIRVESFITEREPQRTNKRQFVEEQRA